MPLFVKSRRTRREKLLSSHPDSILLDVTSRGLEPWVQFSPFFPHGNIPVPLSKGHTSMSVEGIWQGLKVFESEDIDPKRFLNATMKGLKRTVRKYGKVLGHRAGVGGTKLLSYQKARYEIYLPSYLWVLKNPLRTLCQTLKEKSNSQTILLLDYETNCDLQNLEKPLSHAGLIKRFIDGEWPEK